MSALVHVVEIRKQGGEWSLDRVYAHDATTGTAATIADITNRLRAHLISWGHEFTGTKTSGGGGYLVETETMHANADGSYEFRHTITVADEPGDWLKTKE